MSRQTGDSTVAVVGAGPVGLTIAAGLLTGSAGLRVRVLDASPAPTWDSRSTGLRVYALSRASQHLLDRLGAWQQIATKRVSPYRRMCVWQGEAFASSASIVFDCADVGEPDLGHIVEDRLIREALLGVVTAAGGEFTPRAPIRAVSIRPDGVRLDLDGGESLRAALLVAADGSESRVRSLLDMPVIERGYGQHALVTHVETQRPHCETAYQRFLAGGPLAFLPLSDGRSSIVWSVPSGQAEQLGRASDEEFLAALQTASGDMLGRLGAVGRRAAFGLRMLHAVHYCRPRVVLAGDAAHSVHPLAGQGMNLGLLDAACLVEESQAARQRGHEPWDLSVLRRYERRRKGDNLRMLLALDALNALFRLPGWAALLRGLGMRGVDSATLVKRALIRRALRPDALRPYPGPPTETSDAVGPGPWE
jgi:2-octaprenylphenol hydroxylase